MRLALIACLVVALALPVALVTDIDITDSGTGHLAQAQAGSLLWKGLSHRCRWLVTKPLAAYPWPLKPFHRQHPVRGDFGDPRTVIYGPEQGVFSFHNGVDISAWPGNHVYPVVSGRVALVKGDEVVVATGDGRRFQYIHVHPWVHPGQQVIASRTVVGSVFSPWNHVHLTEERGECVVNPLAPGHLTPYVDRTVPRVVSISFRDPAGRSVPADDLSGRVEAVAEARDEPPLATPGPWKGMPVSPALVTWQVRDALGRLMAAGVSADFRSTEPPARDFCGVYAPGTLQNFAAENGHFRWGRPGRYLFSLTSRLGDLGPGRYRLTVTARDTAGNAGFRSVAIDVRHDPVPTIGSPPPDWRCAGRARTVLGNARADSTR